MEATRKAPKLGTSSTSKSPKEDSTSDRGSSARSRLEDQASGNELDTLILDEIGKKGREEGKINLRDDRVTQGLDPRDQNSKLGYTLG